MAKRPKKQQPKSAELTPDRIQTGIIKLERRIKELEKFDISTIKERWDPKIKALTTKINDTIAEIFGYETIEYQKYYIHSLDTLPLIMGGGKDPLPRVHEGYKKGIEGAIIKLNSLKDTLEEKLEDINIDERVSFSKRKEMPGNRNIFIVHGRDELVKQTVARFLTQLDLNPIILHEQPNQGKTIIEKLETHSDVDFAVILLTPDDIGYPANDPDKACPRARQNVIMELGLFVGSLGRERVCVLYKGDDIEIPSDYQGVLFLKMEDSDSWKLPLAREIKQVGIEIDLNKILEV